MPFFKLVEDNTGLPTDDQFEANDAEEALRKVLGCMGLRLTEIEPEEEPEREFISDDGRDDIFEDYDGPDNN